MGQKFQLGEQVHTHLREPHEGPALVRLSQTALALEALKLANPVAGVSLKSNTDFSHWNCARANCSRRAYRSNSAVSDRWMWSACSFVSLSARAVPTSAGPFRCRS